MIEMNIPGRKTVKLQNLVIDVEGTLTRDGGFIDPLYRPLTNLKDRLTLHLLTPNAYSQQDRLDIRLGIKAVRIRRGENEAAQKLAYIEQLGAANTVAIGQGADDADMLAAAIIGICVLGPEGAAGVTLRAADIIVADASAALALFHNPLRIVNLLRT